MAPSKISKPSRLAPPIKKSQAILDNAHNKLSKASTVILWLVNIILPGTAFFAKGGKWFTKTLGTLFLIVFLGIYSAIVYAYLTYGLKEISLTFVSDPDLMLYGIYAIYGIAGLWILSVITGTIFLMKKSMLKKWIKALFISFAMLLSISVGLASAWTGATVTDIRNTIQAVSADTAIDLGIGNASPEPIDNNAKPWGEANRINILILGSDQGSDRVGIRPDILMVASINTITGSTQLFNVPRNLEGVKFPSDSPAYKIYPNGFDDLINAVWTWGDSRPDLYPETSTPGLQATTEAMEETLGLDLGYYMIVNMQGFSDLVDSVDGVTVNVPRALPKGKTGDINPPMIPAGLNQTLNGDNALWFVRSRADSSDYDRMLRQRCMVEALTTKMTGEQIATSLPSILQNLRENFSTNIEQKDIKDWVELFDKVRGNTIQGYAFTNEVINTANPDWAAIKRIVAESTVDPELSLYENSSTSSSGDLLPDETAPVPPTGQPQQENPYC